MNSILREKRNTLTKNKKKRYPENYNLLKKTLK